MPELQLVEQKVYQPGLAADYDELLASLHQVDSFNHDPEDIQAVCASQTSNFYLGMLGERAVAMATFVKPFDSLGHRTAMIDDVAVRKTSWGHQIGDTVVNLLGEHALSLGATRIDLHSASTREAAEALYIKHGFEIVGTRLFRKVL